MICYLCGRKIVSGRWVDVDVPDSRIRGEALVCSLCYDELRFRVRYGEAERCRRHTAASTSRSRMTSWRA